MAELMHEVSVNDSAVIFHVVEPDQRQDADGNLAAQIRWS
jgi:hypothetical protein